jgi:SAM-dependent methyltransferase
MVLVQRRGTTPSTDADRRLNLGCGLHAPEGWTNIDRSPSLTLDRLPVVRAVLHRVGLLSEGHMTSWPRNIKRIDVTKRLPYRDGSIAAIYSSHMLEHLYFDQARSLLRECRRVLRPEGVLRLALPDACEIARQLLQAPAETAGAAGLEFNQRLLMGPLVRPTRRQRFVSRFSGSQHRWQPTPHLVVDMLREAGFAQPRRCEFRTGHLPGLQEVEHRDESFFIEARV